MCPASRAVTVVKVSLTAVLVPLAAAAYVVAIDRFPHYHDWIATSSLVLSHVHVLSQLASLVAFTSIASRMGSLFDALRNATVGVSWVRGVANETQKKKQNVF